MSGYLLLVSTVAAVVVLCYISGTSAQENVVEALVVLDKTSRERWEAQATLAGNTVEEEVMSVMYEVKVLYDTLKSQGVDLSFRLKDGEVRYVDENIVPDRAFINIGGEEMIDSHEALNHFWDWTDDEDFDVAVFIVGFQFSDDTTLGLGHVDRVCRGGVAVIKPVYDYSIVSTIAHEIGHILGLNHDGDYDSCNGDDGFLMSAYAAPIGEMNVHYWSPCSAQALDRLMSSRWCLSPGNTVEISAPRFGRVVGADETCRRTTGKFVSRYNYHDGHYDDICLHLVCESRLEIVERSSGGGGFLFSAFRPPTTTFTLYYFDVMTPEGMPCGERRSCQRGECVRLNDAPALPSWDSECPFGDTPTVTSRDTSSCEQARSQGLCSNNLWHDTCCGSCD